MLRIYLVGPVGTFNCLPGLTVSPIHHPKVGPDIDVVGRNGHRLFVGLDCLRRGSTHKSIKISFIAPVKLIEGITGNIPQAATKPGWRPSISGKRTPVGRPAAFPCSSDSRNCQTAWVGRLPLVNLKEWRLGMRTAAILGVGTTNFGKFMKRTLNHDWKGASASLNNRYLCLRFPLTPIPPRRRDCSSPNSESLFALFGELGVHGSEPLDGVKGLLILTILRTIEDLGRFRDIS
jgi:hypothetical protein